MSFGFIGDKSWRAEAVFSALGDEDADYPAAQLQHNEVARVWRSPDLVLANTKIKITFPALRPVNVVSLTNLNASNQTDKVKVSLYADTAATSLVATSGWKAILGVVYDAADENASWDSGNFWDRIHTELDRAGRRIDKAVYFTDTQLVRTVIVEFDFTNNTDDFAECGIIDPAAGFYLPMNYEYGATYGLVSRDAVRTAAGGVDYTQAETPDDVFNGNSSYVLRGTALATLYEFLRRVGKHTFFWWSPDIDDEKNALRHSYLAKNNEIGLFTNAVYNRDSVPFSFKRVI